MNRMTKMERVQAALRCEPVDRIPVNFWQHHSDKDQDPRSLAEFQVAFMKKFNLDFIKLMPFGLYSVQDWGCKIKIFGTPTEPAIVDEHSIEEAAEWGELQENAGTYGTLGKQVQLAQHVKSLVKDEVPFIQTLFSPLTTALKLAGERIFDDMQNHPKIFHQALQVITNTTINFVKANIEAGVSGFFFASQTATYDLMTDESHAVFGQKYDLQVFDSFKDETFFNMVHICGNNTMFETLANYPANCVNWHDSWMPTLGQARKLTNKCLVGGIREEDFLINGPPAAIDAGIVEAVTDAGRDGLMIGPGCVCVPSTPEAHYYAARLAVEAL